MNEIIVTEYRREISDITRDIREETGQFLRAALRIGRLLFEAKAMVEPGGWTKYIEEELPFSHSWANNYMKLYKEYGNDQISMFGDSQTFANLRPTQALALLAIPAEERADFVEQNDVENMSTRQLQQAIKERDEARKALAESEDKLLDAEAGLEDAKWDLDKAKSRAAEAEAENKELRTKAEKAQKAQSVAEADVKKLKKQLSDAQAAAKTAAEEVKKAAENPEIPESIMDQMRRELEAEATKKAAADLQKQLESAQKKVDDANRAREEAERKLADSEKASTMNNPEVIEFKAMLKQVREDFNRLQGMRKNIQLTDATTGANLMAVTLQLLDKLREEVT